MQLCHESPAGSPRPSMECHHRAALMPKIQIIPDPITAAGRPDGLEPRRHACDVWAPERTHVRPGDRPQLPLPGELISFRMRARPATSRVFVAAPTRSPHSSTTSNGCQTIRRCWRTTGNRPTRSLAGVLVPAASQACSHSTYARRQRRRPLLVTNGDRDRAIPAWASRLFTRLSGLPDTSFVRVPNAGHQLFFDHIGATLPLMVAWLAERLPLTASVCRA